MFVCHCFLIGNIGRDPEVRMRTDGTTVTSTSLAVTQMRRMGEEKSFETEWFRVYAYGFTGEQLAKVNKGDKVFVAGTLKLSRKEQNLYVSIFADRVAVIQSSESRFSDREKKKMGETLDKLSEKSLDDENDNDLDEFPF